jgi:ketosteroid isomerase-like protein
MRALCVPNLLFDDRRRLALLSGDRELMIASSRSRAAMGARPEISLIGTAGERVALLRMLWSGGPQDGRFEIEYLGVTEVDASGLITAIVLFDPDDARAAQREAWARWFAIDPAAHAVATPIGEQVDAFNERDWVKYRAIWADDVVVLDQRLAGMGRIVGAEAYVASVIALWQLAPVSRADIGWLWPAFDRYGAITVIRRTGTVPDGGDFESEYLYMYLVARGRISHVELFEISALDAALARFEELRPDPLCIPQNAAARVLEQVAQLRAKGDLAALRAIATDSFCFDDRGRRALVRGGVDEWLSGLQFMAIENGARIVERLVATAGDRLTLHHIVWSEPSEDARFQIDRFRVVEVDAAGRLRALVLFDPDQRAEASAELFERWVAGGADGVPAAEIEFLRAWNAHDVGRMRALLPDDFVHDDRRRTGLGRVEGADAYVASAAALYELSSDVRIEERYCVASARHARVSVVRRFGSNTEGGQSEAYFIRLPRFQGERLIGVDAFELEDMDEALARFEELRPDSRRIPENAATRLSDRAALAIAAGDRARLRVFASSDFRFEDRAKRALVIGDVDTWLDSALFLGSEHRARLEPELLATLGDRIAVYRDAWSGSTEGGSFELGGIRVFELDAAGQLRALLLFDSDDRAAAFAEALARFAAGEASGCVAVGLLAAFLRAVNERAWDALRETYTADFVLRDNRSLGLGVLDRDTWIASLKASVELSVGLTFEVLRVLAWNDRGMVVTLRRYGSIAGGGGPFENFPSSVVLSRGGRIACYEFFDEPEVERALARFAELCAEIEA